MRVPHSLLHLTLITSQRPHLQIPSHWGIGLQQMNLEEKKHYSDNSPPQPSWELLLSRLGHCTSWIQSLFRRSLFLLFLFLSTVTGITSIASSPELNVCIYGSCAAGGFNSWHHTLCSRQAAVLPMHGQMPGCHLALPWHWTWTACSRTYSFYSELGILSPGCMLESPG